jgi:hypothetical protein
LTGGVPGYVKPFKKKTMSETVFFRKFRINADTQSAVIVVSDQPLSSVKAEIAGFQVGARAQTDNLQFGILSLTDPQTGETMKASHPTIKQLQSKLKVGMPIPGFRLSNKAITDQETGEPLKGLFWVEPIPA